MKYEFFVNDSSGNHLEVLQQLPDKGDAFPTIIMVPGFGVDLHEYGLYDDVSTALVKNGFQTWRFSFAGTGASSGSFSKTTIESQITQFNEILKHVQKDRFTDRDKIGVIGHAFGGTVVIASLPQPQIKSLLFLSPMAHPHDAISKMYKRQRGFDPESVSKMERPNKDVTRIGPTFWASLNHFSYTGSARRATQPISIIHGSKNFKVKLGDISEFFAAITVPKKVHIIQKADHGFVGPFRATLQNLVIEWFEETLRPPEIE